jgi:transposase
MIDKGIPAPGLLAQVVVAKHDDHLPLYRQKEIYAMLERACVFRPNVTGDFGIVTEDFGPS